MSFDPVPWMVGGGAEHSPEVARLLAYSAFRGAEGIVGIGDLRVKALDVPGGAVEVLPGACAILSREVGGEHQAYAGRLPSATQVNVSPTDSGGGRSDLVVARVEDPFVAGAPWADPVDPKVGPYIFVRIIPNVPAGTTTVPDGNGSAIPLARIDLPASTGTVNPEHITDLRFMANPRRHRALKTNYPTGTPTITSAETTFTIWPPAADDTINVPAWAHKAVIRGTVAGVLLRTGNFLGQIRVDLGGRRTQVITIDQNFVGNPHRFDLLPAGEVSIPVALRGTVSYVRFEARFTGGTGYIEANSGTTTFIDVEFLEHPADDE